MGLEDKLVRKKLEILLQDSAQVEAYLRVHGPKLDMQKIQAFKDQRKQSGAPSSGDKNDPTFQIQVKCPLCGEAGIAAYELKSKTLSITTDRFLVPRYEPVGAFRPMNYSLYAVTICPKCLFASPDKKDFVTFSPQTGGEVKSQLNPTTLEEMRKRTDERKRSLQGVADYQGYFKHPRSVSAALAAYRLAAQRARVESSLEVPLGFYKTGMYGLKTALLLRDSGNGDEEAVRDAAKSLKASYARTEITSPDLECQLLYLIVATHIRLKDLAEAQSYVGVLEKMKSLPEGPGSDGKGGRPPALDRWLDLAKDLWANREDPKLWEH